MRRKAAGWTLTVAVLGIVVSAASMAAATQTGKQTRRDREKTVDVPPGIVRYTNRRGPDITVFGEGGLVRVDTPGRPTFIEQMDPCADGDEVYPRCLVCHCDIESVTAKMGFEFGCVFCHGGDPNADTMEAAHVHPDGSVIYDQTVPPLDQDLAYQRFVNPTNLRVVDQTCGMCHPEEIVDLKKGMMATAAGHYAGGLYQNGVQDTKTPIYGTFAITDDDGEVPIEIGAVESLMDLLIFTGGDPEDIATHFAAVPSQACARCHLWSRGKGYRGAEGADGVYRADGCAACHMPYANDGLSQSADVSIDHGEPGHPMHHIITKNVPTEQCLHCHHRGARIGLNFTGRAQMPPRLPSGPGVPGTTDELFNGGYHYAAEDTNPPDIHGELGMHCIDCHVQTEIMGDGNIYGHMDQATKIECQTCHGTPDEMPSLADNDGVPLPNVYEKDGSFLLTSKVTGETHAVPLAMDVAASNPLAACAMNDNHLKAEGGLECYSCHASWVPNCFGCHFERDEGLEGLNLMTGEYEIGKVSTNNKIFESLRHFSIGPNSEGRVAPYLVACQPIADVTAPDGTKLLDFAMPVTTNGLSGLAHNPVQPHTVRGGWEVRTCAECHRAPPALGLGSGRFDVARIRAFTAGPGGVGIFDRDAEPTEPAHEEDLLTDAAALAVATKPNVVEGTADFLFVARGLQGVTILDRREGAPEEPVAVIEDIDAIDVRRAARYLYVVDRGVGVRVYDNDDPLLATLVATVPVPNALRVVPWGIHLFVAAGDDGLFVVDVAEPEAPFLAALVDGIGATDVELYAHFQRGNAFASRAYVADPGYGVRVIDLLPDFDAPQLLGGVEIPGATALDAYTRYVPADNGEPSREHDYLYVAAGPAGLVVLDITIPDFIETVATVDDLGGSAVDIDVASQLAPPGVDDYALIANAMLGLQVVDVTDPLSPVATATVPAPAGAERVLVEVQMMDRFLDEQGRTLKENSHPFTGVFSREDIVRILSASIDCDDSCAADIDGDGTVGVGDMIAVILGWGGNEPAADVNGDGVVDVADLVEVVLAWGPCG